MTDQTQKQLGKTIWAIADQLRGAMNADDFRDYMLAFLFLRYLSDNYEVAAKKELGRDYPAIPGDVVDFEKQMRRKVHYVIKPDHLRANIANLARSQSGDLLDTLRDGFKYIENESFESTFQGLFSEINLGSDKLGKTHAGKNKTLCDIIKEIAKGLADLSTNIDALGDAYEYQIGQFAAGSGKKAGEFYTPQQISTILSRIVTLDSQAPETGPAKHLGSVFDFACGSGSLLLNVRKQLKKPAKMPKFDAVVANPPLSYRWEPKGDMGDDVRFKNHGLAPKSAADFAFLLHGFHYLKDQGVMAIILPHGVLFRGGAEEKIRTKLHKDGHIDTVIGLPANLFYSTGIPVCILVLKKCKKPDDVLFINAAEHFEKGKRQNVLAEEHIDKIVATYQNRREEPRYSKRVSMERIAEEGYNLNIARYISTAVQEPEIDLAASHRELVDVQAAIQKATTKHNEFLKELGLPLLPSPK